MRAALGAGDGVDLVDDDGLDAAQRLPRLAGEQQEQRLGGGDEDVAAGVRWNARRWSAGVSPVRIADRDVADRRRRAGWRRGVMPASGARRLRSTSTASAFSGLT